MPAAPQASPPSTAKQMPGIVPGSTAGKAPETSRLTLQTEPAKKTAEISATNDMGTKQQRRTYPAATGAVCFLVIASVYTARAASAPPSKEDYRHHAMIREGDGARGQAIFFDEQRTG